MSSGLVNSKTLTYGFDQWPAIFISSNIDYFA